MSPPCGSIPGWLARRNPPAHTPLFTQHQNPMKHLLGYHNAHSKPNPFTHYKRRGSYNVLCGAQFARSEGLRVLFRPFSPVRTSQTVDEVLVVEGRARVCPGNGRGVAGQGTITWGARREGDGSKRPARAMWQSHPRGVEWHGPHPAWREVPAVVIRVGQSLPAQPAFTVEINEERGDDREADHPEERVTILPV